MTEVLNLCEGKSRPPSYVESVHLYDDDEEIKRIYVISILPSHVNR